MQEVVDATLLEKVETSIESNKSLQMLSVSVKHSSSVAEPVLKGARGNTSLKKLTIQSYNRSYNQQHLHAAAAELRKVRPQLELHNSIITNRIQQTAESDIFALFPVIPDLC